eukprot:TRINITY_DN4559_c0_g1_i1.p1 TRINITY_DN4559_c0_g1~~TRINITY_DN4559_c0_g1_i1.p1  ORF type:complete len:543 (-),score=80.74 TRINITY_DN4559_c0_g1_i1:43-1671(-)
MVWPQFNTYLVLVAGIYMMSVSGSIYLFSVYSTDLGKLLGYNQQEIGLVATLANGGAWAGVLGGFMYDRFGPRPTAIISALFVFTGYFLMYLATQGLVATSSGAVAFFAFMMGQGSGWSYTVALNTSVMNFEAGDRGTVIGVLVCFFGLCSGIYTQFYKSFFLGKVSDFLLFMAVTLSSVILVFGLLSNVAPKPEKLNRRRVLWCYLIGISVALYLAIINVVSIFFQMKSLYVAIPVFFMFSWFLFILVDTKIITWPNKDEVSESEDEVRESLIEGDLPTIDGLPSRELTFFQAALHIEYWLMFFVFMCNVGAAIVTVDSISSLTLSRQPDLEGKLVSPANFPAINTFVILFSVSNTLSRMAFGVLCDFFASRMYRCTWLIIAALIMCCAQIYLAFASPNMLYFGVILVGLGYGATFSVLPTICCEVFGVKHLGGTWGVMGLAPAIASYLLVSLLTGKLLDFFGEEHFIYVGTNWDDAQKQCYGYICFEYIYFGLTGLTGLSMLLAIILRYRLRNRGILTLNYRVMSLCGFKNNPLINEDEK